MQDDDVIILPNSPKTRPKRSRKESYKWPKERCLDLISLYEHNPVLWDKNHPQYANHVHRSALRARAWKEISAKLKFSVAEVKRKMDTLLASFRREKGMVAKKFKEGGTNCTSGWYGFKAFSFLLFKQTKNQTVNQPTRLHLPSEIITRIKKDNPNVIVMKQPSREQPETDVSDEISSFTNFIASKMRKYSNATNNAVQKEICEIIFKADQKFYEHETCDTTSTVDDPTPSTSREKTSPARSECSFESVEVKDEITVDEDDSIMTIT